MYGKSDLSEEDKKRKLNATNMQLSILDSDQKKFLTQKNSLEAEIRKIKMDIERAQVDLGEKNEKFESLSFKISQNEEEIKRIKKNLASL